MRKFTSLYESFVSRYTRGGFLTGDIVKFKEDAFKSEWFDKQGSAIREKAKQFSESGLLIRVSAVKQTDPVLSLDLWKEITRMIFTAMLH